MSLIRIVSYAVPIVVIIAVVCLIYWRRRPRPLDKAYFQKRWHALQKLCANKKTWPEAVIEADALLDEALKKKRFSGKNMGERLVKAQRLLTDNDHVWFGHKLRTKLDAQPKAKLQEKAVKEALLGMRQALKDLGALPNDQPKRK
jgi:hypothetical protein